MSRIGKQLKIAVEELFIERAIETENNKPLEGTVDDIISDVEENVTNDTTVDDGDTGLPDPEIETDPAPVEDTPKEPADKDSTDDAKTDPVDDKEEDKEKKPEEESVKTPKADKAVDEAENDSDNADTVDKAGKALEEIAELLEQTAAMGGLDPQSADIVNMSTGAITGSLGVAVETIDPELFRSYSKRQQYTLESIESVRKTSSELFKKVIAFIKNMLAKLKEAYRFYNSELLNTKNRFDAVKEAHKGQLKVMPYEERIKNNLPNVLLRDNKTDSIDVVLVAEDTFAILLSYVTNFKKDLTASVATIEDFKEKVFKIDLENEENLLDRFTRKDLSNFGQIFGSSTVEGLKKVDKVKGIDKPSSTIASYESDLLAGRYRITAFVSNKVNLLTDDILASKVLFKPSDDEIEYSDGVEVCGTGDFRRLFTVINSLFTLNRRIGVSIEDAEREIAKLLDYVEASDKKLAKFITGSLEKAGVETNINTGPVILRDLLLTFKNFYVAPIGICMRYTSRYIRGLVMYTELSTKQYQ